MTIQDVCDYYHSGQWMRDRFTDLGLHVADPGFPGWTKGDGCFQEFYARVADAPFRQKGQPEEGQYKYRFFVRLDKGEWKQWSRPHWYKIEDMERVGLKAIVEGKV